MTLDAALGILNMPGAVEQGTQFPVKLCVANTGTEVLDPTQHKIGTQDPQDNHTWGVSRIMIPAPVAPGASLQFPALLTAPTVVAATPITLKMVKEGIAWFGNTVRKFINVAAQQPLLAPPRADPNDLVSDNIINTSPFPADGIVRKFRWANTSARTVLIHKAHVWLGVDQGHTCDAGADLIREADSTRIVPLPVDHYADGPFGAAHQTFDFQPYYVTLAPGEAVILLGWGNWGASYDGPEFNVHFSVYMWWRYGN